jgi:hypothetical protein
MIVSTERLSRGLAIHSFFGSMISRWVLPILHHGVNQDFTSREI